MLFIDSVLGDRVLGFSLKKGKSSTILLLSISTQLKSPVLNQERNNLPVCTFSNRG